MKGIVKFFFSKLKKKLSIGLVSSGGRNFLGRICVYHRGSGNKLKHYFVDRYRRIEQFGYVYKIIKFPSLSSFVGMVIYDNGLSSFVLLSHGLFAGSKIFSGVKTFDKNFFHIGSSNILKNFGLFSVINSIETFPFSGQKLVRAAGSSAFVIKREKKKVVIKLNSGWQIKVSAYGVSSYGACSNPLNKFKVIGKAGKNRAFGIRPTVRGVIKNPCDHPHGGGEGKGSPPVSQVTPWGFLTKGTPTKNRKADRLKRRLFKTF